MTCRIIICQAGSSHLLSKVKHEKLMKVTGHVITGIQYAPAELAHNAPYIVAEASDEDILENLRGAGVSLLYFSREDYENAMQGLSAAQKEEAAAIRMMRSGQASRAAEWLFEREKCCLSLLAVFLCAANGRNAGLEDHFGSIPDLMLLARRNDDDRSDFTPRLHSVIEGDSRIIAELSGLGESESNEAATRRKFATDLGREAAGFKACRFTSELPRADVSRVVFIRDDAYANADAQKIFQREGYFCREWNNGVMVGLPMRDIISLEAKGKKFEVLYLGDAELRLAAMDLSGAQLDREFGLRYSESEAARSKRFRDYLNGLRLDQALLRRHLRNRAKTEQPSLTALLDPQIKSENSLIAGALADRPSWLPSGISRKDIAAGFARTENGVLADARFFAAFFENRVPGDFEARFREIATTLGKLSFQSRKLFGS